MSRLLNCASARRVTCVLMSALLAMWMLPAAAFALPVEDGQGGDLVAVGLDDGQSGEGASPSADAGSLAHEGFPAAYLVDGSALEAQQADSADTAGQTSFSAQSDDTVYASGNWRYQLTDEGNIAIVGHTASAGTLVIPDTLEGKKVTELRYEDTESSDRNSVWGNATTVKLGKNVEAIGYDTFYDCTNLTAVDLSGSSVSRIGLDAFCNTGITSLVLPQTLVKLQDSSLDGMYELRDLYLSAGLQPIYSDHSIYSGNEVYQADEYYSPAPRSPYVTYHVPANSQNYKLVDGVLFSKDGSVLYSRPIGMDGTVYTVPSSVRYIADYAFFGSEKLQSVTLNEGLYSIGENAFALSTLTSVAIPSTVRIIGNWAFCRMPNLKSVTFKDGLVDLGEQGYFNQFFNCPNLATVRLPETLQRISDACFAETAITSIDIPASVAKICYGAFGDNQQLVTVTGCEGVEKIEQLAFRYAGISSFPFGNNLRFVSGTAFFGCANYPNPAYPAYLEENDSGDYVCYDGPVYVLGTEDYDMAYQVLDLVNEERAKEGLDPLVMDAELLQAAMQRAAELTVLFSHTRPSGETCFTASGKMTAENVATRQPNAQEVMKTWMNSSGHRGNIMDEENAAIGVGCFVQNGNRYWVQVFGTQAPSSSASKPANAEVEHRIDLMLSDQAIQFEAQCDTWDLCVGESAQVYVLSVEQFAYGRLQPKSFAWTSSNPKVATVDASGVVSLKSAGNAAITAHLEGTDETYLCALHVHKAGDRVNAKDDWLSLPAGDGNMYRLYNPNSGEHFYTASPEECVGVHAAGWVYEGVGWTAPTTSNTPVYRLYNPYAGDHHYTMNASERDALKKAGWLDEGIGWYSDDAKGAPLYRQYNPNAVTGTHNYTTDKSENDALVKLGWKAEGIGWYGLAG